ncbi:MAG: EMC3/TMCO1 family protein [Candidatus Thorarchaeota archaeon]
MQDIFVALTEWFAATFKYPPLSVVLITLVSVGVSTTSNLAMKRFSDIRRLRRYQAEIKAYQELTKRANETQNEKLLRKVRRRKAYIDRIQKEMMTARCKPYMFFIIPFMMIFYLLTGFYTDPVTGTAIVVAVIPFHVEKVLPFLSGWLGRPVVGGFGMYFFGFYMLVGLGLGQILQRVMGTSLT